MIKYLNVISELRKLASAKEREENYELSHEQNECSAWRLQLLISFLLNKKNRGMQVIFMQEKKSDSIADAHFSICIESFFGTNYIKPFKEN